jgi:hypothetical protein
MAIAKRLIKMIKYYEHQSHLDTEKRIQYSKYYN